MACSWERCVEPYRAPAFAGEQEDQMTDTPEPTKRVPHTVIWHDKLAAGFRRTTEKLGGNLAGLLTKEKLDRQTLDEIEEALIASDLGPVTAARVRERVEDQRYDKGVDEAGNPTGA